MEFNRVLAASLVVLCLIAALLSGSEQMGPPTQSSSGSTSATSVLEQVSSERIAVFSLRGQISAATPGGLFPDATTSSLQSRLRAAADEDKIKAVLLRINSPGGTVGTSQELYRAVQVLRDAGKPIIAVMEDVAASGGYYVASATDKIYANPGTLTGSIGVIIQGLNVGDLLREYGVEPETYKTGEFKDLLSPFREASEAEQQLLQELVDTTLEQFIADVSAGRQRLPKSPEGFDSVLTEEMIALREGMDLTRVRDLADGRIFTGEQAMQVGLVDALGGYEEAIADLRTLAGDEDEDLVVGGSGLGFDEFLRQVLSSQLLNQTSWGRDLGSLLRGVLHQSAPAQDPSLQIMWLAPNMVVR